ncbi:hypothetical protein VTL71DRAFT_4520 [Oculimacula yallundae]|uniref:Uncharacterized protein n=1 Tax=Oculimacula yallundae TaxID=86028 RepID=A0ABR4C3D5_9HELO
MHVSIIRRWICLLPVFSSFALATTGQIPVTAEPTPTPTQTSTSTTTTEPDSTPRALPTVSYTTTLHLPDLNLHLSSEQLDDPDLENIISSLLPAEMFTLLVSATARSASLSSVPSPLAVPTEDGTESEDEERMEMEKGEKNVVLVTRTEALRAGTTSVSMLGKGWRGVVAAETRVEVKEGRVGL